MATESISSPQLLQSTSLALYNQLCVSSNGVLPHQRARGGPGGGGEKGWGWSRSFQDGSAKDRVK